MSISFTMPTMPKVKVAFSGVVLSAVLASGLSMGTIFTQGNQRLAPQEYAGACHRMNKRHTSAKIRLRKTSLPKQS